MFDKACEIALFASYSKIIREEGNTVV